MFGILVCFVLLVIVAWMLIAMRASSSKTEIDFDSSKFKPKIGAEISNSLYDEVTSYCRKNRMTISDLIRKSVRLYMDTYK